MRISYMTTVSLSSKILSFPNMRRLAWWHCTLKRRNYILMSALADSEKQTKTRKRLRLQAWEVLLLLSLKSRLTMPWEGSPDRHCIPKPRNQVRMSALANFEKCREIKKSIRSPEWRLPVLLSQNWCCPAGVRRLLQQTLHNKIGHERDHECACGL